MAQQTIDIGSAPDDGTGDTIRVGGDKINDNFTELYTALGADVENGNVDIPGTLDVTGAATFDGKVGVGISGASADGLLHVHDGSAGTVAAPSAYPLVVERSGATGIMILTPNNVTGEIRFGDPESTSACRILYDHSTDRLGFRVGGSVSPTMMLDAGTLFVNESANANMTTGITINQGTDSDEILVFKSGGSVSHGRTGLAETDTYFAAKKISGGGGGTQLVCLAENSGNRSLEIYGSGGVANTEKTTNGVGLVNVFVEEHDGANSATDITADGNVFSVRARVGGASVTRLLVDEDGDLYSVTAAQTFDDHDDLALLEAYDITRRDALRDAAAGWSRENEEALIALGILGGPVRDGGMTNVTQLQRLLVGAVRQVNAQWRSAVRELVETNALEPGPQVAALLEA